MIVGTKRGRCNGTDRSHQTQEASSSSLRVPNVFPSPTGGFQPRRLLALIPVVMLWTLFQTNPPIVVLVESWSVQPATRKAHGRNQRFNPWSSHHKHPPPPFDGPRRRHGLFLHRTYADSIPDPSFVRNEDEAAAAATKTPLDDRIARALETVDTILQRAASGRSCETSAMGQSQLLEEATAEHARDFALAQNSCLEVEDCVPSSQREQHHTQAPGFSLEPVVYRTPDGTVRRLAVKSNQAILDDASVRAVRAAAEAIWRHNHECDSGGGGSRFTYQSPGNSEAHVFDFAAWAERENPPEAAPRAIAAINEALRTRIYPMIRKAFVPTENGETSKSSSRLFVYDALVIRYNATAANEAAFDSNHPSAIPRAAGQPLHRDLGLVSVNIMLNHPSSFEGGGTLFENQGLVAETNTGEQQECPQRTLAPLTPMGVGHCLMHPAFERHAGAGTTRGVRDILVLFVAAVVVAEDEGHRVAAPAEMLSARLKNPKRHTSGDGFRMLLDKLARWRLAVQPPSGAPLLETGVGGAQQFYCDGEAMQYLGLGLTQLADFLEDRPDDALEAAVECLEIASILTPRDSRVYNNLGIALGKLSSRFAAGDGSSRGSAVATRLLVRQEASYRTGREILRELLAGGCTDEQVRREAKALALNHGLCVANQGRFDEAAAILEPLATAEPDQTDAHTLWKYCCQRASTTTSEAATHA